MSTSSLLATPWQKRLAKAKYRAAIYRDHWLKQPGNYPPPPRSPADAVHAHHQRWLASSTYAHIQMILRDATSGIPSSHTKN